MVLLYSMYSEMGSRFMVILEAAAVRVDHNVVEAGVAEYLCIHVTAPIPPEVKFPAILAEWNFAAVTEDDGGGLPADRARGGCVLYNDHGLRFNISAVTYQYESEGYYTALTFGDSPPS